MLSHMNIDSYKRNEEVEEAIIDIIIDQLHKYADLENEKTAAQIHTSISY